MSEFANHSEEIAPEAQETVEQVADTQVETQIEGQDSPPQEEPRGIKVKYNKEERFVPEDEVPNWVQKGLNYDKISEKAQQAERYQEMLDRTAKYYGYPDSDSYMQALEQAEMEQRIQEEAEKLGVGENVIRDHLQPLNQKVSEYEKQLNELREADLVRKVESQIQSMENDTANFPDFGKYKNDVINMAASNGYSLDVAYKIVTYDERVNTARAQAEQEAIRKLQQNADSSTGSLGADAPDPQGGYMSMTPAERKAFRDSRRGRAI
ncbi:hypothetical protein MKZ12_07280 [Paenibacillus sp. FSL R5-0713]|uniref:hypothetical protein n=1 Tax=Paenibacillus sp. FSL R5-0713 TaxID=2921655 RepID=UPI0030DAD5D7